MASKIVIDSIVTIQAGVSFQQPRVVAPSFVTSKSIITSVSPSINITQQSPAAFATYSLLEALTSYSKLEAIDVFLDADSKNQYFLESISLADTATFHLYPVKTETFGLISETTIDFNAVYTDSVSFSDDIDLLLTFYRDFSDQFSLSDVPEFSVGKGISDTATLVENFTIDRTLFPDDTFAFTDAIYFSNTKVETDSFSFSDNLTTVMVFNRSLSDAFTLDDAATVDAFTKDYYGAKANIVSMADQLAVDTELAASETAVLSELAAKNFGKTSSDITTLTESLSSVIKDTSSSVINVDPFNVGNFKL